MTIYDLSCKCEVLMRTGVLRRNWQARDLGFLETSKMNEGKKMHYDMIDIMISSSSVAVM